MEKHEWIDMEDRLISYLDDIDEMRIYVGEGKCKIPVSRSMSFSEWNDYFDRLQDVSEKRIDLICLDDCLLFKKAAELLEYFQRIYKVMNHDSELIVTFRDLDFIRGLPQNLEDMDSANYIQRHLFHSEDSIQDIFLDKSWEEKAKLVMFEKWNTAFRQSAYSADILANILQSAGFDRIHIGKGRNHCIEKISTRDSWTENLEYASILAKKSEWREIGSIYIVENAIDAISRQEGIRDVVMQRLCKQNGLKHRFIYLEEANHEELYDRCDNFDVDRSFVSSIYHLYTNIKPYPITYTLHEFLKDFQIVEGHYTLDRKQNHSILRLDNGAICKLFLTARGYIRSAEIYIDHFLMSRMLFTYTRVAEERFSYDEAKVASKETLFFNENGSVAYRHERVGDDDVFYLPEVELYSKEEFYRYVIGHLVKDGDKVICGESEYRHIFSKMDLVGDEAIKEKKNIVFHTVKKVGIFEKEADCRNDGSQIKLPLYVDSDMNEQEFNEALEYIRKDWGRNLCHISRSDTTVLKK